jgi:FAD synthetase
MVFGVFDGLHPGHDFFLREAAKHGDELIVVIARDSTIREVKQKTPKHNEQQRFDRVAEHPVVTGAVYGTEGKNRLAIVYSHNPDVICLGYDQDSFVHMLEKDINKGKLRVRVCRLPAHKPELYKSTLLNR